MALSSRLGHYRLLYPKHYRHSIRTDGHLGNDHVSSRDVCDCSPSLHPDEGEPGVDLQSSWTDSLRIPRLVNILVLPTTTPLVRHQSSVRRPLHFHILRYLAYFMGRLSSRVGTCPLPRCPIDRTSALG